MGYSIRTSEWRLLLVDNVAATISFQKKLHGKASMMIPAMWRYTEWVAIRYEGNNNYSPDWQTQKVARHHQSYELPRGGLRPWSWKSKCCLPRQHLSCTACQTTPRRTSMWLESQIMLRCWRESFANQKIPSEMEEAPRNNLLVHCLLCLLCYTFHTICLYIVRKG